jgi:hypothetical protein
MAAKAGVMKKLLRNSFRGLLNEGIYIAPSAYELVSDKCNSYHERGFDFHHAVDKSF